MDWASYTHPGTREMNEDSLGTWAGENDRLFVVADGLGGHGKGDVASGIAVKSFQRVFEDTRGSLAERMEQAFAQAQKDILDEQMRTGCQTQMKTTAVALAMEGKNILWGHIGDTRLYAFKFGRVWTRTLDHSVPQMLVMAREIHENEIRNHPERNMLLRVLGVSGENPRFELSKICRYRKYSAFLLCTDGFWELILEKEMENCLRKASSARDWLEQMVQIISRRGQGKEMDNFSAIGVIL